MNWKQLLSDSDRIQKASVLNGAFFSFKNNGILNSHINSVQVGVHLLSQSSFKLC